ncbi:MAG: DNA-directed DNA polymerase II small subunit [Candidatus Micrarchaeia archaeon]
MIDALANRGLRVALDAESIIANYENIDELAKKLSSFEKMMITKEDAESAVALLKKEAESAKTNVPEIEVRRDSSYKPLAAEYSADIKTSHTRDVTGKSRSTGEIEDFIEYFRSRYQKLSKMLHGPSKYPYADLGEMKKHLNQTVKAIVLVSEISQTKKGNILLQVEDMTGSFKVVISKSRGKEKLFEKAGNVILDDVIAIIGKVFEPYIIAEDIEWPDLPITREKKTCENDLATAYLSDIHFGSRYFLEKYFELFTEWLNGKGEQKELAGKVKYVVVAGDIIDGIGIYPNQEKELIIKDVSKQYAMFDDFISRIPDYIEVIIAPGNHDAVRRGEPMPSIGKDLITSDVTSLGNPATVSIEGIKHLVYHGTSIDSIIATLPNMSYNHPEKVMVEYLKRRHLSTIYGGNLIIPEKVDYLAIEEEPDVLHCGHVHKNGYALYRGTVVINSGTFQDRTEFQVKQGHVPTPAMVPVYEMKQGILKTLDFKIGQ